MSVKKRAVKFVVRRVGRKVAKRIMTGKKKKGKK